MTTYQPTNDLRIMRGAAARIGCSVEEYQDRRARGEKWCGQCQEWHPVAAFPTNRTRPDGLSTMCRACKVEYDTRYNRNRQGVRGNAELLARNQQRRDEARAQREADRQREEAARRVTAQQRQTRRATPPAAPQPTEAAPVEQPPTVAPPTILARVDTIMAELDAAVSMRVRQRQQCRAARRRSAERSIV